MIREINPERAEIILSVLDQIETLNAFVKAEMNASRGSVGTAPEKSKKKTKADKIREQARAEFHKRK